MKCTITIHSIEDKACDYICGGVLPDGKFVPFTKQQMGTDVIGDVVVRLIFICMPVVTGKVVGLGPVTILIVVSGVAVLATEVVLLGSVVNSGNMVAVLISVVVAVVIGRVEMGNVFSGENVVSL